MRALGKYAGRIACGVLLWGTLGLLQAQPAPSAAFTLDIPGASGPLPSWLQPVGLAGENSTLSQLAFAVNAPGGAGSDLLLTVIFDEKDGGFLRLYRKDGDTAETVAENLFEGTGLPNRRILLLHNVGAQGPTTLVFQASGADQPIRRLVWEWPQVQAVPVAGAAPGAIRQALVVEAGEASGQPLPGPLSAVDVSYTATPLLDQPTRVEDAVAFSAVLSQLPRHARLAADISGLPLGRQLDCWVNGKRVGTLAAPLPSLRDPAYLFSAGEAPSLAAWRTASLYLPAAAWQEGENQVEFRPADSEAGGKAVYALKNVVLELLYGDTSSALPPAAPPTSTP